MIEILARARASLSLTPPHDAFDPAALARNGDHVLNEGFAQLGARPAAVLVALVARPEGTSVLLTQRAAHLREHSGQIAFPGGKIDPADASPMACALREAHEEVGLEARFVEPIGYLDPYQTGTGYRILPLVAMLSPGFALSLNAQEVADAFEAPLAFLMDPANHLRHSRHWAGRERFYYAMPYRERYIWGATAGILRNLYERLHS